MRPSVLKYFLQTDCLLTNAVGCRREAEWKMSSHQIILLAIPHFLFTKIIFGLDFVHSVISYTNAVITYILLNHTNLLLQFLVLSFKIKSQTFSCPFDFHFECTRFFPFFSVLSIFGYQEPSPVFYENGSGLPPWYYGHRGDRSDSVNDQCGGKETSWCFQPHDVA